MILDSINQEELIHELECAVETLRGENYGLKMTTIYTLKVLLTVAWRTLENVTDREAVKLLGKPT